MIKQLGIYSIHSEGKVWSNKNNKFLKPALDKRGYYRVGLFFNGKSKTYKLHRLIAEMFIPKIEGKNQVNHINGIKTDNRIENLEWCNNSENQKHAWNNGLNRSSYNKIVIDTETGVFYESATELSKLIGLNRSTLISRLNGTRNVPTKYKYA